MEFVELVVTEFSVFGEIRLLTLLSLRDALSSLSSWFAWWGSYCLIVCKDC